MANQSLIRKMTPRGRGMQNHPRVNAAIKAALEDMAKMSPEELRVALEKHKTGDIAIFMQESGAIDIILEEQRKRTGA